MTTRSPKQLEMVRELAQAREQELATEVGELMRLRAGAEATLERLGGYLAEYAAAGGEIRKPSAIANERRFVKRLNQALDQQRAHARRLGERAGEKMVLWERARADLKALDRLAERRQAQAVREGDRREQREADALTTRRAATEAGR